MGIEWWYISNYIGLGILIDINDIHQDLIDDDLIDYYPITENGDPNTLTHMFMYIKKSFKEINAISTIGPYIINKNDHTMSIREINNDIISEDDSNILMNKYLELNIHNENIEPKWYSILTSINNTYYKYEYDEYGDLLYDDIEYDLKMWNELIYNTNLDRIE